MRLSWNEVRIRAARFADEWRDAAYEKGETQSFYNAFFEIFDVRRRSVARYEEHVRKLDNRSGFIDLFWPGFLIVEQKSAGRDLGRAYGQAGEYFDSLPERDRPRYILVSDFQSFELRNLDEGEKTSFSLADLHAHVEAFGFILGVEPRTFRDQDPVNVEASEAMGRLWDGYMMRLRHLVTVVMTWRCSWFVQCSACSPMTLASSSREIFFLTYLKPGLARTVPTSAVGLHGCSRC